MFPLSATLFSSFTEILNGFGDLVQTAENGSLKRLPGNISGSACMTLTGSLCKSTQNPELINECSNLRFTINRYSARLVRRSQAREVEFTQAKAWAKFSRLFLLRHPDYGGQVGQSTRR